MSVRAAVARRLSPSRSAWDTEIAQVTNWRLGDAARRCAPAGYNAGLAVVAGDADRVAPAAELPTTACSGAEVVRAAVWVRPILDVCP
jgi:hypothetical protein